MLDRKKLGAKAINTVGVRQKQRRKTRQHFRQNSVLHISEDWGKFPGSAGLCTPHLALMHAAEQRGSGLCPQLGTTAEGFLHNLIITLHFSTLNSLSLLSSTCSESMQIALIKAKDSHCSTNLLSERGCGLFFSKHQETAWEDKAAQPQRTKKNANTS